MKTRLQSLLALFLALAAWGIATQLGLSISHFFHLTGPTSIILTMTSMGFSLAIGAVASLYAYQKVIYNDYRISRLLSLKGIRNFPIGLFLGGEAIFLAMSSELFSNNYEWKIGNTSAEVFASTLVFVICVAFQEEVLYRFVFMDFFRKQTKSVTVAIILQAILFVFTHSGVHWGNWIDILYYFVPAIVLGMAMNQTNNLYLVTGIHAGLNWALGALCGGSMFLNYSIIQPTIPVNMKSALFVFSTIFILYFAFLSIKGRSQSKAQHSSTAGTSQHALDLK